MNDPITLWLLAAVAAGGGGMYLRLYSRMTRFERENHALWYYTRHLIDWGYKNADEPPPLPPQSIAHLYEYGDPK